MVKPGHHIPLETSAAASRWQTRRGSAHAELWTLLDEVRDPEIPALSIWEIGVLQNVERRGGCVAVTITPTYSGCPAMRDIEVSIRETLGRAGFPEVDVVTQLLPPWTTDWLSAQARRKLHSEGISASADSRNDQAVCPRCGSPEVQLISPFSGTACKALHRCSQCLEVFDHFKAVPGPAISAATGTSRHG